MRRAIFILIGYILFLNSCTKEEYIDFIESEKDTIKLVYSHDLTGHYAGTLSNIFWTGANSYVYLNGGPLEVDVVELTYTNHLFYNISNDLSSNADVEIFRYDNEAYLYFNVASMSKGLGIDTIFNFSDQYYFNGRYDAETKFLEYFINFTDTSGHTTHQIFEGYKEE